MCDKPVSGDSGNERGVVDVSSSSIKGFPWPTCAQLPCVCLGDPNLKVCNQDESICQDQSKQVLRFECNATTNFDSYIDVTGKKYIIPKVENCGTYRPDQPTPLARCQCPDLPDRRCFRSLYKYTAVKIC